MSDFKMLSYISIILEIFEKFHYQTFQKSIRKIDLRKY